MAHETEATPVTQGVHHIGLTVPELQETTSFFVDVLGYRQVGEVPDYPAVFLSDNQVLITLWQATDPEQATHFDRKNVIGLHHLALTVRDEVALKELHQRLAQVDGVAIEFAPEPLGNGPTQHMMCSIPGGIRTEFIAPAA